MQFKFKFIGLIVLMIGIGLSNSMASVRIEGDSVGVERVGDKLFILHKVTPQETLFAISRKYQVSVDAIQSSNEVLKQGLKIGQTIRIPYIEKNSLPSGTALHKVNPGETLFSISKKYNVSVDSLKQWNSLQGNDLSVGQALVIKETSPTQNPVTTPAQPTVAVTTSQTVASASQTKPAVTETKSAPKAKTEEKKTETPKTQPVKTTSSPAPAVSSTPVAPGEWISHTVKSGETLFSLSSQYGSSVEELIQWNALSSNNLRSGQVMKVGRAAAAPSTVPVVGTPKVAASSSEMKVQPTMENTSGGFKNITETGQAELIEGTAGHKKYLVLHRTAPVGSVMRVKNEENDLTIFARVVGTLPDTGDNSKLVIKLSQAAYDQLKAVNPRFPVEVLF